MLETAGPLDVFQTLMRTWLYPLLVAALLLIGFAGRVRVYDSMIEGAREGLDVAVRIVPYLVAILVAVAMFRASGALDDLLIPLLRPLTDSLGVPAEVLPMALLRPLSGSGAFAVMSEIISESGPDSFTGYLTSTLMGSTETTFYVLALYYGAARIRDGRHALAACLTGDVAGFLGAVAACHWFFGCAGEAQRRRPRACASRSSAACAARHYPRSGVARSRRSSRSRRASVTGASTESC